MGQAPQYQDREEEGANRADVRRAQARSEIGARPGDDRASGQGEDAFLLPVLQPDADDGAGQEGMISTKGKNDGEKKE